LSEHAVGNVPLDGCANTVRLVNQLQIHLSTDVVEDQTI
jgi:hypothetical protein